VAVKAAAQAHVSEEEISIVKVENAMMALGSTARSTLHKYA